MDKRLLLIGKILSFIGIITIFQVAFEMDAMPGPATSDPLEGTPYDPNYGNEFLAGGGFSIIFMIILLLPTLFLYFGHNPINLPYKNGIVTAGAIIALLSGYAFILSNFTIGLTPTIAPLIGVIGGILVWRSTLRDSVKEVASAEDTIPYEIEHATPYEIEDTQYSVTKALIMVGISTLSSIEAEAVFQALRDDGLFPKMHRLGVQHRVTIKDMDTTNWTLLKYVDPETKKIVEYR